MATERKGSDLGARLREARERKGLTLRQIANDTKITLSFLEALERNDISRLPGGIFSRSFVRSFAAQVGLDVEQAVEDFVSQFPTETVTVGHKASSKTEEMETFESDRKVASTVLWMIGVSIPLAALVLYLGFSGRLTSRRPSVQPSGSESASPAASPGPLKVEIAATRACTLTVTLDGQSTIDVPLVPGARRTFDVASDLDLTFSDSGGVEWSINGRPGRPLGSSGPVTVHLTTGNYEEFLGSR